MRTPRGLSEDEAAAWARLAATVEPMRSQHAPVRQSLSAAAQPPIPRDNESSRSRPTLSPPPAPAPANDPGLDSHWERRLRAGSLAPDFTLDLHEHSLDAAYQRLLGGLDIAKETGARVVLVIAGRERPTHSADRGGSRGAIRAKLLDWLAASRHASAIAAIRKAHRRHGGEGALYVILKRPR